MQSVLAVVALDYILHDVELDSGLGEDVSGVLARVVAALGDDSLDADAGDKHGTDPAGLHSAVERRAVQRQTVSGRLTNSVLLSMSGSDTM